MCCVMFRRSGLVYSLLKLIKYSILQYKNILFHVTLIIQLKVHPKIIYSSYTNLYDKKIKNK